MIALIRCSSDHFLGTIDHKSLRRRRAPIVARHLCGALALLLLTSSEADAEKQRVAANAAAAVAAAVDECEAELLNSLNECEADYEAEEQRCKDEHRECKAGCFLGGIIPSRCTFECFELSVECRRAALNNLVGCRNAAVKRYNQCIAGGGNAGA